MQSFDLASPEGSLNGSAELFPGPEPGVNTVEARIRNFDLLPIWKQLKLPFDLASRSTGRISLKWKGAFAPSQIAGDAHLRLDATRSAPGVNLLPVSGILDAQFTYAMDSGQFQFQANGKDLTLKRPDMPGGNPLQGTINLRARAKIT